MKKQTTRIQAFTVLPPSPSSRHSGTYLIPFERKPVSKETFFDYEMLNLKAAYQTGLIDEVTYCRLARELREKREAA